MRTLLQALQDADEAVLAAAAAAWGLKPPPTDRTQLIETLNDLMLDPDNAERMWESLSDNQRQALQTVLGGGGKIAMPLFKRLFGDIRRMGRGAIDREQPQNNADSAAEALFYRGLVAEAYTLGNNGSIAYAFVPDDLVLVLPTHKTAYDDIEAPEPVPAMAVEQITETRKADTSIVDDMTTLLAFLQLFGPPVDGDSLARDSVAALHPYLLTKGEARVAFMVTVGISAELIEVQNGRAYPRRADARQWLEASRSEQIEALVRAWLDSEIYRELWHVPGLTVERVDSYTPSAARRMMLPTLKDFAPASEWFDVDEYIYAIKSATPDFQRPNGDYDSWYIMDMGGEYVRGFESWDTVEGALIEYLITGPMHWLGLLDVAPEAARMTAYGRGVVGAAQFPRVPDAPEPVIVEDDGTLLVTRKVSRIDRFQVARFTTWETAPAPDSGDPFAYVLDMSGVRQADTQGINTGHITTFLRRMLGDDPVPEKIERVLRAYQSGDAGNVTLTPMVVLRTTSEQVLDDIVATPELRRFLGARLGPMAVAVRQNQ
ncbi:MAG: hypothetical protein AAFR22_17895, partial [Chloroflexota bacterium]